jgi:AraC-like DNA-binding protein
MDPLSDVLSLLKPRSYVAAGFDVGGEISLQFRQHQGIKCYAIVAGSCWLCVDGVPEPVRLTEGDCFLLPRGRPFRLTTDPALPSLDALSVLTTGRLVGSISTINGGGDATIVGGHFTFTGNAGMLLEVLPAIVHIRKESDKLAMRWSLERLMQELREPQLGSTLVAQQLAYLMLVQALRLHLEEGLSGGIGWLFALADSQMNAAITAMHDNPANRWTLHSLAQRAGVSRSIFALKFKASVGASPMEYLTRWRMLLAADRLKHSTDPISVIAQSLGYESESAFCKAFRRVMGCSPRRYGRDREPVSDQGHVSPAHPQQSTTGLMSIPIAS